MKLQAIVWRRTDFRESSRIVTLVSRELGRIRALAKGAHRHNSPLIGKLDFLNRVEVTIAGRGMPILGRTILRHEPRTLREPQRFRVASYVAELFDRALIEERPDREMFELIDGGLTLVERAPADRLRLIVAGLELRLLRILGQLPSLTRCSQCGVALNGRAVLAPGGGVFCEPHAPRASARVSMPQLAWLDQLVHTPGGRWPTMPVPDDTASGLGVLARWIGLALEDLPRSRDAALAK